MTLLIALVILVALIIMAIAIYNKLVRLRNTVKTSWSDIDVQCKKRYDLVPNLVETVKGYAKHETAAIRAVTDARKALVSAKDLPSRVKANAGLETALKTIFEDLSAKTADQAASAVADAIDTYVKTGTIAFSSGNINGSCPPSGGPLTGGTGTGGTIS